MDNLIWRKFVAQYSCIVHAREYTQAHSGKRWMVFRHENGRRWCGVVLVSARFARMSRGENLKSYFIRNYLFVLLLLLVGIFNGDDGIGSEHIHISQLCFGRSLCAAHNLIAISFGAKHFFFAIFSIEEQRRTSKKAVRTRLPFQRRSSMSINTWSTCISHTYE